MTRAADDRLRRWLLRWSRTVTLRQTLLAIAAVAVLASGLFGGLATATPEGPAELKVGRTIHAEPFDLSIERARQVDDLGLGGEPRGRSIAVVAKLTNTSDHPVYGSQIGRTLQLRGLDGVYRGASGDETGPSEQATPQVLVLADASILGTAAPGLEYEVAFVWEQAESEPVPTRATVAVAAHTWRKSRLDDQFLWFDPVVTHSGDLAVEPGRES
ncbi:hypothetical protein GL325_04030 [Aeromicrobium sp. 636]|uniref:Uncharacterized protein n=1 Tax=Aeromicrobium senzhongii TaxID=2663859 RepID=A0A8I0JZP1_9ACTN|nr:MULTISPECIES: hypothetical protein [Aeromicrobium]MBC9225486.1 hypothetical protein [Aeromicrobium senzhongii]MCQ3997596.1 hypothetical protein [Aeromicrobium sp. 636]